MDKQYIIANIDSLTAGQLFDEIKQGNITLKELRETGNLDATKRTNINNLQAHHDSQDNAAWDAARYGNETDIRNYISKFPKGKHLEDAKNEIDRIRIAREKIEHEYVENIRKIKANLLTPDVVKQYLDNKIVDDSILRCECNMPNEIIERIKTYRPIYGENILGPTPAEIPNGFTEVYFWGIPNSGKTCALSTILNTAHKKGYMQTGEGTGLKYLHTLKNLYKTDDNIGYLLENTPDKTQYLPFTLKKDYEKYARSVSLIELSGEVFKCFCKKNIGEDLDGALENTFTTLNNFLNNNNRKIHFFFIDYDPTSIEQDEYNQSDYLEEASKYFTKHKIFSESTDAIYVVITKSDLIEGYGTNEILLADNINKYIDDNFKAFDNYLNNLCRKEKINAGKYDIIPFSIGDVYCKRICKINRKPAEIIINRLFERIQPQRKTLFDY
jgi:hypothetical protein